MHIILIDNLAYNDRANRRRYFEDYAKENGFDPLVPENWYMQPKFKLAAKKV
jgi:hypothetical protein